MKKVLKFSLIFIPVLLISLVLLYPKSEPVFTGTNKDFVEQVNTFRALNDLNSVQENPVLDQIASEKCADMVNRNYFEHKNPDGEYVDSLFKKHNLSYSIWGENIAQGQTSMFEVTRDWYASPSHKANIIKPEFIEVGHAVCRDINFKVVEVFRG